MKILKLSNLFRNEIFSFILLTTLFLSFGFGSSITNFVILLIIMGYMMILLFKSKQKIFNQKQKIQQLEIINQTITKTDDKMKESFKYN